MKVARVGTTIGGALLAICCQGFAAEAFDSVPAKAPSATTATLPEFLDSARLPEMQDAWRSTVIPESQTGELAEPPPPGISAQPGPGQPVRKRAEELSGRFSDSASGSASAKQSSAGPKAPPTDLSEAAMPQETPTLSQLGAGPPVPPAGEPPAGDARPSDVTTTATLRDAATDSQPAAETARAPATWLKAGVPPLPQRSPRSAKAHAKAVGANKKGASAKAPENSTSKKSAGAKSAAGKVASSAGEKDDDDKPVRQFRAPVISHVAPAPRPDPGRKEVFPPYLGAYGWQPKITN